MKEDTAASVNISHVLDKELCEKLVQASSLTIGCNVLVTDEKGYVYASNIQNREGTLHEGSLEVIESGQTTWHDEEAVRRLSGTMPGITIPLLMENRVIGTIGITGDPKTVAGYAALVQQMTQVFMGFQRRQQASAGIDNKLQNLVREIIHFDARITHPQEIRNMALELGADLELSRAVILIQKSAVTQPQAEQKTGNAAAGELVSRFFRLQQDFVCRRNDGEQLVLACLPREGVSGLTERCRHMEEELRRFGQFRIGIGTEACGLGELRRSYENAAFAVRAMQTGVRRETVLTYYDLNLERLAAGMPDDVCAAVRAVYPDALFQSQKYAEIMEIIDNWCRHGFHFTNTARALHVHKSTLTYRFQRIRELYGLDIYDFQQVIPLFLLYIRSRLA